MVSITESGSADALYDGIIGTYFQVMPREKKQHQNQCKNTKGGQVGPNNIAQRPQLTEQSFCSKICPVCAAKLLCHQVAHNIHRDLFEHSRFSPFLSELENQG